ncbi:MAG TPA: O-antigen ligase family protein [Opitutaceae bacterium]|nr:O-antigen ligase family protein [Opitutaceae bacterium]
MPAAEPSPSRATSWEWAQAVLLAGNLAWTTLCLGGYRPETMVLTSALTAALLLVHCGERALAGAGLPPLHAAGWWLLPFLGYAAANAAWVTPVHWLGWLDWFGWAQMIAFFWVGLNGIRGRGPQRLVLGVLITLAVISVVLACYQRFVDPQWMMLGRLQSPYFLGRASGSFGIPNSLAAFFLLLLPMTAALALRRSASAVARVAWGWVAVVLAFGLVLTISRGAWLGLALALVAWPLAVRRWSWQRRLGFAAAAVAAIVVFGALLYQASPRARERLAQLVLQNGERTRPIMWRAAWKLFGEQPLLGTGAGSYNTRFEKYRPEGYNDDVGWAHNDYLNTLSDYGAVGFALFFGPCALIVWQCRRARRPAPGSHTLRAASSALEPATHVRMAGDGFDSPVTRAAIGVGLLAFALQLGVDFHFKIPALAMTFGFIAAFAVGKWIPLRDAQATRATASRRAAGALAAVAVALAAGLFFRPLYRSEALRYHARQAIDRLALEPPPSLEYGSHLAVVRADLAAATAAHPANAQAWADRAYAETLWVHVAGGKAEAELGRAAEAWADRAIALAPLCPDFWMRRSVARDMQGRWLDAGNDSMRAVELAPNSALAWYYHAFHLSRRRNQRWLADAAVAFCLRLDPWNPAGLALRQRLAISPKAP